MIKRMILFFFVLCGCAFAQQNTIPILLNDSSWLTLTHSITSTWYGACCTNWIKESNWTNSGPYKLNLVPQDNDTAIFNNGGNGKTTLDLSGNVHIKNIIFDTASCAAYKLRVNTNDACTFSDGGAIVITASCNSNQTMLGKYLLGGNSDGTFTVVNSNTTKAILFSQNQGIIEGNPNNNGTCSLIVNAVNTNTTATAGINIAGFIRDSSNGVCKVKLIKLGAGLVNVSSSSGGQTYSGGTYLNQGALSFVGNVSSIRTNTSLFINTNTTLLSVNQTGGTYSQINQYWNGNFAFNDPYYFADGSMRNMTFNGGYVDLGQYGSDAVRTVTVVKAASILTVNSTISNGLNGVTTGLAKAGAGTLTLGGTNAYTDGTYVNAGTLSFTTPRALFGAGNVYVTNSAVLNLNFTGTGVCNKLYLAGTSVVSSVYGVTNLVSTNFLTGAGFLSVTNGP